MAELGESTEMTNELIMDSVKGDETGRRPPRWHTWVAMSTLLMALLTALGALLAGITAHEALLARTEEIIAVSTWQSYRVTVEMLKTKHEILINLGETPDEAEISQIQAYVTEVAELETQSTSEEAIVQSVTHIHLVFAITVTLLAVGISLSGMAIIVEQRWLWYVGMVLGVVGSIGVGTGIAVMVFS